MTDSVFGSGKRYEVIYKDPKTEQPKAREVSEDEKDQILHQKANRQMVMVPGIGTIEHFSIKGVFEKKQRKDSLPKEYFEPTRFETSPPSKEQWIALQKAVMAKYWYPSQKIFLAICKSLWNLNSPRTQEMIKLGVDCQEMEQREATN